MNKTSIQWCDYSWSPVVGCSRVSAGCQRCYAERLAATRLKHMRAYRDLARIRENGEPQWTGDVRLLPERLEDPLRHRKPARIFVCDMGDLFHEGVPDEYIAAVFGAMAACPQHQFQVLTKRPDRMQRWLAAADSDGHCRVMLYGEEQTERLLVHRLVLEAFDRPAVGDEQSRHIDGDPSTNALWNLQWGTRVDNQHDRRRHGTARGWSYLTAQQVQEIRGKAAQGQSACLIARDYNVSDTQIRNIVTGRQWNSDDGLEWPLTNCHLGVSVEDQAAADERIPLLLQTPAAVRFLSIEPLLGPVRLPGLFTMNTPEEAPLPTIDWVIVGAESGPKARPCNLDWIRFVVRQCKSAGVSCFVKQIGARPVVTEGLPAREYPGLRIDDCGQVHLRNRKGGDPSEWCEDLRVREMPNGR